MAREPVYGNAINSLLNDLPRLLLQYKADQNTLEMAAEKLRVQEQISLSDAIMNNMNNRIEIERSRAEDFEEENEKIQSEIRTVAGYIPSSTSEDSTLEGRHFGERLAEQLTGPYKEMAEEAINNANMYADSANKHKDENKFLKDIKNNLITLEGMGDEVRPDLAGAPHIAQQDDFSEYFDTTLTGDNPGQYREDDPMYGFYRNTFVGMAPSYADQMKAAEAEYVRMKDVMSLVKVEEAEVQNAFTAYSTKAVALFDEDGDFTKQFKKQGNYSNAVDIIKSYNPGVKDSDVLEARLSDIIATYGSQITDAHIGMELLEGNPEAYDVLKILFPTEFYKVERSYSDYKGRIAAALEATTVPGAPGPKPKQPAISSFDTLLNELDQEIGNE